MSTAETATVTVGGKRLAYTEFGFGDRVVVLTHAFMMSERMERTWAQVLAHKGFRVICPDLLGDDVSSAAPRADRYGTDALGAQLLGVLDALGIDKAVLGGTSIGASVSIEAAVSAPDRVIGLVLEAPFLERGVTTAGYLWSAGLVLFTIGRPIVWLAGAAARLLPRKSETATGHLIGLLRDLLTASPRRSAEFMRGMTMGRMAPPSDVRAQVSVPTLILSVGPDPFHPTADARRLASDIADSELVNIGSLATLRLRPNKVTPRIVSFLTEVWGQVGTELNAHH